MEKHYELQRNGNEGWVLNRGTHQISITRLKEEIQIGPVFKKEQCGVTFHYQNLAKDSIDPDITFSLKVIDSEHDNTDHSLVYMTRKMLEQVKLGTFGGRNDRHHNDGEFLEYILKYLGEDPNTYLDKEIDIPIDTPEGKLWFIRVGDYHYTAKRRYSMSSGYFETVITSENVKLGVNQDKYKYRTSSTISKTAEPLDFQEVIDSFK